MLEPRYYKTYQRSLCAQKSCVEPYLKRTWDVCNADSVAKAYANLNADFAYLSIVTNAVWLTLDPIGGGITRTVGAGICYGKPAVPGMNGGNMFCGWGPSALGVILNLVPLGLVIDQLVQYNEYVTLQNNHQNSFNTYCEPYKYYIDTDYDINFCTADVSLYKTSGTCSLSVKLITSVYPYTPGIDISPGLSVVYSTIQYSKSVNTDYAMYTAVGKKIQQCYSAIEQLYQPGGNSWYVPTDQGLVKFFGVTDQEHCLAYSTVQSIKTMTTVQLTRMFKALRQIDFTLNPSQYDIDIINSDCNHPSITFNSPHSANRESIYVFSFPTCTDTLPICGEVFTLGVTCATSM